MISYIKFELFEHTIHIGPTSCIFIFIVLVYFTNFLIKLSTKLFDCNGLGLDLCFVTFSFNLTGILPKLIDGKSPIVIFAQQGIFLLALGINIFIWALAVFLLSKSSKVKPNKTVKFKDRIIGELQQLYLPLSHILGVLSVLCEIIFIGGCFPNWLTIF